LCQAQDTCRPHRARAGKVIASSVAENQQLLHGLLGCTPCAFKPSVPHLVRSGPGAVALAWALGAAPERGSSPTAGATIARRRTAQRAHCCTACRWPAGGRRHWHWLGLARLRPAALGVRRHGGASGSSSCSAPCRPAPPCPSDLPVQLLRKLSHHSTGQTEPRDPRGRLKTRSCPGLELLARAGCLPGSDREAVTVAGGTAASCTCK
jgi:hypothetical protein